MYPLYPMDAIHEFGEPSVPELRPVRDLLSGYSYLEPTDIGYAKVTPCFENGKGIVGRSLDGPTFATSELTVLRPREGTDQRFLSYVLQSDSFRGPAIASMTGAGGLKRVSGSLMRDLLIPAPPLAAQRAIADYVDHETAEIDAFIADQEELLDLANERRRAQIARKVAGADTPTFTTTLETPWAPTMRTPYEAVNIRRAAAMRTGHTPSRAVAENWSGERNIPWFTLADVWQLRAGKKFMCETAEKITKLGLASSAAELLPAGTVVLSRTASVGFTGIMPSPMATSQDFWNWVCTDTLEPEYLWYQFRAMRPEFDRIKSGSTHKTIYQADAAALRIILPPLEDQRRIVADLQEQDKATLEIADDATDAIALAKERRTALITAATTGRIDVTQKRKPVAEQLEEGLFF